MRSLHPFCDRSRHGGMILLALTVLCTSSLKGQSFINVAPALQLDLLTTSDNYGSGVSFYDFDGDGWDDLTFATVNDSLRFYRNVNGTMQALPSFVYADGHTRHALWADIDNDGDEDLLMTTYEGTCRMFKNMGDFEFEEITANMDFISTAQKNYGASFGDYDNDGFLDLYISVYESDGSDAMYDRWNHLYHNNGDGTFTDVTLTAGVGNGIKLSFQAMWFDYDLDGWQDLYVINDRWYSNTMYRNNGDGTFSDVTDQTGLALPGQDPMSISIADLDNDGDMDFFHTNTGVSGKFSKLMQNNGDGTFTENAIALGLDTYLWAWGAAWLDFTNNSYLDLYITTALPNGGNTYQNLVRGNLDGVYVDASAMFVGNNNALSFSPAVGDLDNNGRTDLVVQNKSPHPPYLWRNNSDSNHYIKITPKGTVSNRNAVGSWVHVYFEGEHRVKYTVCGENYLGQSSQHLIFGIGSHDRVDSVKIQYLSGHIDTYYDLQADQAYTFFEGETYVAQVQPLGELPLCAGENIVLDAGDHNAWSWNTGDTTRYLTVAEEGEYSVTVWNDFGVTASATFMVEVSQAPAIITAVTQPACFGEATGSIILQASPEVDLTQVLWSDLSVGPSNTELPAGEHGYSYTDGAGCVHTQTFTLVAPPELEVSASSTPATSGMNNGAIEVTVSGGTPPYMIFLDEEPANEVIEDLFAGTYDLQVVDANDCTFSDEVQVDLSTEIHTSGDIALLQLHPNPVRSWFSFGDHLQVEDVVVMDMGGRIALQVKGPVRGPIDATTLISGPYMLSCRTSDGTLHHQRLIKLP